MPNPFQPLTLSVEEWQKLRSTDLYFIPSKQDAIYKELEAQAQAAASLREQLAQCYYTSGADPDGNEDWRVTPHAVESVRELRNDYDQAGEEIESLKAQLEQAQQERDELAAVAGRVVINTCIKCGKNYPQWSVLSRIVCEECRYGKRASHAEAALEEMQKQYHSIAERQERMIAENLALMRQLEDTVAGRQ